MSMTLQEADSKRREAEFLAELRPILSELYRAIESGVSDAQDYFESRGFPINWHLFSHLVRHDACNRLDGKLAVSEVEYRRESLAMSGIEVAYGDRKLKVFKASYGILPAAGKSSRRQKHYQLRLDFMEEERDEFRRPNWVVLWDTDKAGNLLGLQLVLPKSDGDVFKSGQQIRTIEIPHPAEMDRQEPADSADAPKELEFETDSQQDQDAAAEGGSDER